jgi:hypothetical protein
LVPRPGFPIAPILTGQFLDHPTRFPQQIRRGTIHVLHEHIDQAKIPAPGLSSSRRCVFEAQYPRMQGAPVALDCFRAARVNRLFQPCADTVHPHNVRFQNVRFQNVRFQNVRFQNVGFTKRQVYKTSGFKTSGFKTSSF